ncbi:MAG: transposase [candidate division KSB1 bacterium]|nr:transposase [candidate division KSB1 bacterium]
MNGLVIWHRGNLDFSHNGLKFDVEEANGLDEVGTYIGSSRNDHLFPGTAGNYTAFTPYTNPNSNKQDGTRSGFALTCIKVNGSGASAYVTANAYLNFYTGTWSGNVTTNTAWGGTVTVTTNVTVNSGVTLTIDPGSVIQFQSGTSLTVNGKLIADSNDPTKRITFTGTTATPGFWNGIKINSGSSTNVSTLRRCDVQYATTGITITYTGNTNNITIDKCKVRNNSSFGLYVAGNGAGATVHPTLSNNTIASNNNSGIYLTNYAKPTITGNRIENNGYAGIEGISNTSYEAQQVGSGYQLAAKRNFWSGLTIADGLDGLRRAARDAFPPAKHQRCFVHKMRNVLDKIPHELHDAVQKALQKIYNAGSRADALSLKQAFVASYGQKYPKAVKSLNEAGNLLFSYFDFPEPHWKSIKSTKVIESMFAAVKLRSDAARRIRTPESALYSVFKLLTTQEQRLHEIRGYRRVAETIDALKHSQHLKSRNAA